jgi:hypothetical protein
MKTVVGVYEQLSVARHVVDDLVAAGFGREHISLVAADQDQVYAPYVGRDIDGNGIVTDDEVALRTDARPPRPDGSEIAEGAGIGALIGGLGGLLVGLGALAVPGVGPIIAAGPILAALTGAGLGAVTGGLVGALVDLGIPNEEADLYAEGLRRGYSVVAVQSPDERVDQARLIMDRAGLIDLQQRAGEWRATGWSRFDPTLEPTMRPA